MQHTKERESSCRLAVDIEDLAAMLCTPYRRWRNIWKQQRNRGTRMCEGLVLCYTFHRQDKHHLNESAGWTEADNPEVAKSFEKLLRRGIEI